MIKMNAWMLSVFAISITLATAVLLGDLTYAGLAHSINGSGYYYG